MVRRGTYLTSGPFEEPEEASGRPERRVSDRTMVRIVRPGRCINVLMDPEPNEGANAETDSAADPEEVHRLDSRQEGADWQVS